MVEHKQYAINHIGDNLIHQFIPSNIYMKHHSSIAIELKSECDSFEDNYSILSQIGDDGKYCKVYQIKRKCDSFVCVAKIINKTSIYSIKSIELKESYIESLQNEMDIMRLLNHKYIIKLYDIFETEDKVYIIMEECKGGELFDKIIEKQQFKEEDAKRMTKMIVEALFYLHNKHNVIYCDLKPSNIVFKHNNFDLSHIKLIDFGMAKISSPSTFCKQLCGTPYYTAPEVIDCHYTHSADMWSLGVLIFCMVFGYAPFYVDPDKYTNNPSAETYNIYKLIKKGFDPQIKNGYGPWFPADMVKHEGITDKCMDLISNLMTKDIAKRLTAKEVLQHEWLNGYIANIDLFGLSLYNYCIANKLKKYILCLLYKKQYQLFRSKYITNLMNLFKSIGDNDGDDDDKISYKNFEKNMLKCNRFRLNKNQIRNVFNAMDINSSGYITFDSFLNAAIYDHLISDNQRLLKLFMLHSNNGFIYIKDLRNKMKKFDNICDDESFSDLTKITNDGHMNYDQFLTVINAMNKCQKNEYKFIF